MRLIGRISLLKMLRLKMDNNHLDDDDEYILGSVKGKRICRKRAVLNKTKITKNDLDLLFLPEEKDE